METEGKYTHIHAYVKFQAFSIFFRPFMKAVGRAVDSLGPEPRAKSFEFCASLSAHIYYYMFYRNLFDSVDSYTNTAVILCLHCCYELLLFVGTTTEWYFDRVYYPYYKFMKPGSEETAPKQMIAAVSPYREDWTPSEVLQRHRDELAVEYGHRFSLVIYSFLSFIVIITFCKYGYNTEAFYQSGNQYSEWMKLSAIALSAETVTHGVIISLNRVVITQGPGFFEPWMEFLRSWPNWIWAVFNLAHVTTDTVVLRIALPDHVCT